MPDRPHQFAQLFERTTAELARPCRILHHEPHPGRRCAQRLFQSRYDLGETFGARAVSVRAQVSIDVRDPSGRRDL